MIGLLQDKTMAAQREEEGGMNVLSDLGSTMAR